MKKYTFILLLALLIACKNDKPAEKDKNKPMKTEITPQKTTYYFIRHAEKELGEPSNPNPHLTEKGLERAAFWAGYFENKKIDLVFSTDYTRTIQTVIPTLDKTQREVTFYEPYQLYSAEFMTKTYGKNVLIVGHQDSLIKLINQILGENKYKKIPANVYGNLYTVIIEKDDSKFSSMENFEDFGPAK